MKIWLPENSKIALMEDILPYFKTFLILILFRVGKNTKINKGGFLAENLVFLILLTLYSI
jgi:hypothetical protein